MKFILNFLKLAAITSALIFSLAQAQSVGGGGGEDRPSKFLSTRVLVLDQSRMRCDDLTQKIEKLGRVRLNFKSEVASVYKIVYGLHSTACSAASDVKRIAVETLDTNRCWAGYVCQQSGFR